MKSLVALLPNSLRKLVLYLLSDDFQKQLAKHVRPVLKKVETTVRASPSTLLLKLQTGLLVWWVLFALFTHWFSFAAYAMALCALCVSGFHAWIIATTQPTLARAPSAASLGRSPSSDFTFTTWDHQDATLDSAAALSSRQRDGGGKCRAANKDGARSDEETLQVAFDMPLSLARPVAKLASLCVRDFVASWYTRDISVDDDFLRDSTIVALDVLGEIVSRVSKLQVPLILLGDVAPVLRRHVRRFNECRRLVTSRDPKLASAQRNMAFYERYERAILDSGFPLHPFATENGPNVYVRALCGVVVPRVLSASDRKCFALCSLLREVAAVKVLGSAIGGMHPHVFNAFLVSALEAAAASAAATPSATPAPSSIPKQPTHQTPLPSVNSDGPMLTASAPPPISLTTPSRSHSRSGSGDDASFALLLGEGGSNAVNGDASLSGSEIDEEENGDEDSETEEDAHLTPSSNEPSNREQNRLTPNSNLPLPLAVERMAHLDQRLLENLRVAVDRVTREFASSGSALSGDSRNLISLVRALEALFRNPDTDAYWPWLRFAGEVCGPNAQAAVNLIEQSASCLPSVNASGVDVRGRALLMMSLNHGELENYVQACLMGAPSNTPGGSRAPIFRFPLDQVLLVIRPLQKVPFLLTLEAFWSEVVRMNLEDSVRDSHFAPPPEKDKVEVVRAWVSNTEISLDDGRNRDSHPHVDYIVTVRATQSGATKEWALRRRFRVFEKLHSVLLKRFPHLRGRIKLPKKRGVVRLLLVTGEFDPEFITRRSRGLTKFLDALCDDPEVRCSREFKSFLGVLDSAEGAVVRENDSASGTASDPGLDVSRVSGGVGMGMGMSLDENGEEEEEEEGNCEGRTPRKSGDRQLKGQEREDVEANLAALVDEVLQLRVGQFSFLRRRIVDVARLVVKRSFSGRVYDAVRIWSGNTPNPDALGKVLTSTMTSMWPNDAKFTPQPVVIPPMDLQEACRQRANELLRNALPAPVVSLMGREHCDGVAQAVHDLAMCPTLNRSLVFDLLDVGVARLFPDVDVQKELRPS